MATPLEIRNLQRDVRSAVRVASNALDELEVAWAALAERGRGWLVAASDHRLRAAHAPHLELDEGLVAEFPDLRAAAEAKAMAVAASRAREGVRTAEGLAEAIEAAQERLEGALGPVSERARSSGDFAGRPVFGRLSLDDIEALAAGEFARRREGLALARAAAAAMAEACGATEAGDGASPAGKDADNAISAREEADSLRVLLEALIVAWGTGTGAGGASSLLDGDGGGKPASDQIRADLAGY